MNLKRLRDSLDYTPEGWRYRSAFAQTAGRGYKNKDFWDGVYPFSRGNTEKVSKHGRLATLRRNTQIVSEVNMVIAFPSPDSKGTFHTIREAQRMKKQVMVVTVSTRA